MDDDYDNKIETYIVSFIEDAMGEDESAEQDRSQLYFSLKQRSESLVSRLQKSLDEVGLSSEVRYFGEPSVTQSLVLQCSPRVAKFLSQLPEVDAVIKDIKA